MNQNRQDLILETKGLSKRFGGAQVINQVDMQIHRGEVRCVIGPNGAGKSTFFKLLTGEHTPSGGEIRFFEHRLNSLAPFQRIQMGMSIKFQIPGIFPDLSVEQHLRLSLSHLRPQVRHEAAGIDELLQRFKLSAEKRQLAGNLSHGKKQWLEIAMAVSLRPALLLLDEPVAGLSVEETYLTGECLAMPHFYFPAGCKPNRYQPINAENHGQTNLWPFHLLMQSIAQMRQQVIH